MIVYEYEFILRSRSEKVALNLVERFQTLKTFGQLIHQLEKFFESFSKENKLYDERPARSSEYYMWLGTNICIEKMNESAAIGFNSLIEEGFIAVDKELSIICTSHKVFE